MKKLELKNLKVKEVSRENKSSIKGGFLSIGHACSHRNHCDRLQTRCYDGSEPGGGCEENDELAL